MTPHKNPYLSHIRIRVRTVASTPRRDVMNRRNILSMSAITALGLTLPPRNAFAQQGDEWTEAWHTGNRFRDALRVLDNGEAMEKVWAHTKYVTYVGPGSRSIIIGWEAQKKYWADTNKLFSRRDVKRIERVTNL